jgi:hypothetical protein
MAKLFWQEQPQQWQQESPGPQSPPQPTNLPAMQGHPAADPPAAPPASAPSASPSAPEMAEVMIGGQTFKVDKATAMAIEAQRAYTEELVRQSRQPAAPPAPMPPETDYEAMMFTDPSGYTKKVIEEAKRQATQELTGMYQQQRGMDEFMSQFYAENDDLKSADDLVKMELQMNLPAWGDKPVAEARKLLANKVRGRLFDYVKKFGGKPSETPSRTTVEGGQQPGLPPAAPDTKVVPMTAGKLIAQRRAQRLAGKSGT